MVIDRSGNRSSGRTRRILGIDPGIVRVGWGVVDAGASIQLVDFGTVKSDRETPHAERLLSIFEGVREVIERTEPDVVAVEEVFVGKSPRSTLSSGEGRGACILAGATAGLPVVEYPAAVVKVAVTGNGRAAKTQVQAMVARLLRLDSAPTPHDAADALAVAITHFQRGGRALRVRS